MGSSPVHRGPFERSAGNRMNGERPPLTDAKHMSEETFQVENHPTSGFPDASEMYYNAALTPGLGATFDLQVIDSALKKTLDLSSGQLRTVDTPVLF